MAPGTKEHARFIFRGAHHFRVAGLQEKRQGIPLRTPFLDVGAERNEHEVVLRLAEGAADDFRYADDFVGVRARADSFADGVHIVEKLFRHVRANEAHGRVMLIVGLVEESAGGYVESCERSE